MNEPNAQRLREFSAVVRALPADTVEKTRSQLLTVEPDGNSIVDRFRRANAEGRSMGAPFAPEELMGALRETGDAPSTSRAT